MCLFRIVLFLLEFFGHVYSSSSNTYNVFDMLRNVCELLICLKHSKYNMYGCRFGAQ
jgi:hypothetical protein